MIRLHRDCDLVEADPSALATLLDATLTRHGREAHSTAVDLLVLDDEAIGLLNARHKNRRGPTDVLAFEDGAPDDECDGATHLGDVAVSAETALREARARACTPAAELSLYAVHGVLHLLGFRDHEPHERAAMRRAEAEALERVGLRACWRDDERDGI